MHFANVVKDIKDDDPPAQPRHAEPVCLGRLPRRSMKIYRKHRLAGKLIRADQANHVLHGGRATVYRLHTCPAACERATVRSTAQSSSDIGAASPLSMPA